MIRILTFVAMLLVPGPIWAAVKIQDVKTPGGLNAWLVEEHSIPFVALEIRFRGGSSLDEPGKRGASYLMSGLLEEGAGDMNAQDFLKAKEALATDISFDIGRDSLNVSARFLSENRDQALELLRAALIEPRFDADAVERVRTQVGSIIADNQRDPQSIAMARFNQLAFGDHPYGSAQEGTPESLAALSVDDLRTAWRNLLARDRIVIGVVGDISAAELGPMLDNLLGGLPAEGSPMPKRADLTLTGGTTVIDFPTPQSVAIFGQEGIEWEDPDYFAAYVMNHMLGGGGFNSRLQQEVRVKRGLTYGVYSWLASYDLGELIMGSVQSANDRVAQAVDVIREEWRKMAEDGVSPDELDAAKTYLTGAYALRFDGNGRIASILAGMQLNGLPIDYIETRNDRINAITRDDISRVAKRLLKVDDLRVVVVGRPKGLESTD